MSNTNNLITFLDSIGRTIIGSLKSESDSTISVENPALVHVQINNGNLQLQILPLFFKELSSKPSAPTTWVYKKHNITISENIEFSDQFTQQYKQIFSAPEQPKTVKLFDE